jgi:hypothetical protein
LMCSVAAAISNILSIGDGLAIRRFQNARQASRLAGDASAASSSSVGCCSSSVVSKTSEPLGSDGCEVTTNARSAVGISKVGAQPRIETRQKTWRRRPDPSPSASTPDRMGSNGSSGVGVALIAERQ